jgi:membrane fusion protein, multidrug efflux system
MTKGVRTIEKEHMNATPDNTDLRAEIATKGLDDRGNVPAVEIPATLRHQNSSGEANPTGSPRDNGAPKKKNTRRYLLIGMNVVPALVTLAFYYARSIAPFESTDDAFIEAHITPIAPQVAGRVSEVLVRDNQFVNAGDVLLQLDPSDYEAKLEQGRANLASAKSRLAQADAQFTVEQAKVEQEKANVIAAAAEAQRAEADSKRYQAVGTSGVSQSQLDLAATQSRSAAANLSAARNKQLATEAQEGLAQASIQTAAAEIKRSEAAMRQAELDLSYTQVKAQEAGYVTRRSVEAGAYVQPGQSLLSIVAREVWVVANFKESQLTHMRAGQPVTVKVDAYPKVRLSGRVDSIQRGAGARFSLFPPENATGNYVKVVQRVPVKIVLDQASLPASGLILGPGMSAEPKVRVK